MAKRFLWLIACVLLIGCGGKGSTELRLPAPTPQAASPARHIFV